MNKPSEVSKFAYTFRKLSNVFFYRILLFILGFPLHLITFFLYQAAKKSSGETSTKGQKQLEQHQLDELIAKYSRQIRAEKNYFNESINEQEIHHTATQLATQYLEKNANLEHADNKLTSYREFFAQQISKKSYFYGTFIFGIVMYAFLWVYGNAFSRYIVDRLVLSIFVVVGVSILVFTILYFSPMDPAANILGESATTEQKEAFNEQHGLNESYGVQLKESVQGIFTFDLGKSFTGKEDVSESIANKFPVTLKIAVLSLLLTIIVAIPIGMLSAAKMNTFWDYALMFIALIGLSIPSFWQGLIMILEFSIKLQWLPATYSPEQYSSIIMPVIVLGTGLTAAVARMTRSSILEVINEDYMITAKAKGLGSMTIFFNHALRNAMIPIITVIGLQFGAMLGGAAVTEKVFNISGIGSYIVDKQFIPDIPAIMGGVVYIAITISLVNLIIDILYALLNPRVRSKMKNS